MLLGVLQTNKLKFLTESDHDLIYNLDIFPLIGHSGSTPVNWDLIWELEIGLRLINDVANGKASLVNRNELRNSKICPWHQPIGYLQLQPEIFNMDCQ